MMYLGALGQRDDNGNKRRKAKQAAVNAQCGGGANVLPSRWTAGKYPVGSTPTSLGLLGQPTWDAYVAYLAALGYPPQVSRYWFECKAGYPMYWNWRIAQQVKTLVPTAEETAEAFVEEVKKIAPPPPIEKPTVVKPWQSRVERDAGLVEKPERLGKKLSGVRSGSPSTGFVLARIQHDPQGCCEGLGMI